MTFVLVLVNARLHRQPLIFFELPALFHDSGHNQNNRSRKQAPEFARPDRKRQLFLSRRVLCGERDRKPRDRD